MADEGLCGLGIYIVVVVDEMCVKSSRSVTHTQYFGVNINFQLFFFATYSQNFPVIFTPHAIPWIHALPPFISQAPVPSKWVS